MPEAVGATLYGRSCSWMGHSRGARCGVTRVPSMSSFSSLGEPGVSRTVGRTSVMGRLPELQTLPILGLIMSTTRRTVILSIGWPAILIGLLVLLVAVTPDR